MRVRTIEKKLKLPIPSVIRYCKELKTQGILATIKIGNVTFYTANKTNPDFILEKKLHNLKSLYTSKLIEHIKKELSNPSIIVFGSYSKEEDAENSDIDLYIETPSKKELNLKEYEKKLQRTIQIFRQRKISEINNSMNGISLNGYVEVL